MIELIISALWLVGQAAKTPASHAGNAGSIPARVTIVGVDCDEDPPVPIPNTEVKPLRADGTWLETARESRSLPDSNRSMSMTCSCFLYKENPTLGVGFGGA